MSFGWDREKKEYTKDSLKKKRRFERECRLGETERKKVRLRRKKERLRKWLVRVRQREKRMNRR